MAGRATWIRFHQNAVPAASWLHTSPVPSDAQLTAERCTRLDRLYAAVTRALGNLATEVGLKVAA